jgi:hypothetical protein
MKTDYHVLVEHTASIFRLEKAKYGRKWYRFKDRDSQGMGVEREKVKYGHESCGTQYSE